MEKINHAAPAEQILYPNKALFYFIIIIFFFLEGGGGVSLN